jgi:hypothetical protein
LIRTSSYQLVYLWRSGLVRFWEPCRFHWFTTARCRVTE